MIWIAALAILGITVSLTVPAVRRPLISSHALRWFRSVLPPMSATEKAAIDAGTTWWDAELFSGKPDWHQLMAAPTPELSDEEQAFLAGPVDELCEMLDDWQINHELNDLPEDVWQFMKKNRFFGIIVPKEYGGLQFSAHAQSEIVMKIATRSVAAAITVMVPNSLGPGELLLHYGTDKQKSHYLPRLAVGEEVPAFALTSPHAGSDAGAMPDVGVVCRETYQGSETLGFRVNWNKRYITLSPVCTVLGLAFRATDPQGLLGDRKNLGITCALVPAGATGVTIGARHEVGCAFQNGPNSGEDVFVPMEWIIGGQEQIGKGWKMLMNCLSVGRAISLPALGAAAGKVTSLTTGAYSRIRRQFNMPIGKFEGIEEVLARIGGLTYRMDASRLLTTVALDQGEKPSVLGAILKYHNTEGMRQVINDAMDIHAGRAICDGPTNYLQNSYRAVPVAITVEGANILTRSMIIFGQGAIRCHPYVLEEMAAAAETDETAAVQRFDAVFFKHIGLTIGNALRSLGHGLTGARFASSPKTKTGSKYYKQLTRMSAAFAFLADVAMLQLGGELKRRERISARFGDVLSHLYMASAALKKFADDGSPDADLPLVDWAVGDSLFQIQTSVKKILENFPSPLLGRLLKLIVLPFGQRYRAPADSTDHQVASLLLEPSASRDRLINGTFVSKSSDDPVALLHAALDRVTEAERIEETVATFHDRRSIPATNDSFIREAQDAGAVNELDTAKLREYRALVDSIINVDAFAPLAEPAQTLVEKR